MKYCPDCDRKIPKDRFGNNKNSKDGKQTYCLTHYRIRRKKYNQTQHAQKLEKQRKLRYRASGKESQYNKEYYRTNRMRILARKRTETIGEICTNSRTEMVKDGKKKGSENVCKPRKSIVLNPKPVKPEKHKWQ
jgi:hypothetical protein